MRDAAGGAGSRDLAQIDARLLARAAARRAKRAAFRLPARGRRGEGRNASTRAAGRWPDCPPTQGRGACVGRRPRGVDRRIAPSFRRPTSPPRGGATGGSGVPSSPSTFSADEGGADGDHVADFGAEPEDFARDGRGDFDRRLVGHHGGENVHPRARGRRP